MRPYPWKTRIALPAIIALAVLAATGWSARDAVLPATDVRVIPVVLKPVSEASLPPAAGTDAKANSAGSGVIAQAAGWVEPDPYAVAVPALTDGIVRDVLVLEGDRVAAGDVIVQLIDDDAKLAAQRAEAELASKRAELQAAQVQWDNPVERERAVAASKAALEESRAELSKIDADVAAERARAAEMADLAARLEQLVPLRASAEQELVSLRFKLEAQQAVVKATEARRPVLEALIRQKEAEVAAAEENAKLRIEEARSLQAAKADVAQAEVGLAEATLRLSRTAVRSPSAGVIMNRLVEPGSKLMAAMDSPQSSYVARLYEPAKLQVRVDVPLADAHKIGVGTQADVTAEALPGRTLRGEVTRVVNEADLTKNTLQFKVRIVDVTDALKPEMLARVKFLATTRPAPTTATAIAGAPGATGGSHLPFVPDHLIKRDGQSASVLIADRDRNLAIRRPVTLASATEAGWVAVSAGIAAGADLIAEPNAVADGARIRIVGEASATAVDDGRSHGKDGH
jgi:multidrug efflux pump subunit AcrA (membrane-fusion protein)